MKTGRYWAWTWLLACATGPSLAFAASSATPTQQREAAQQRLAQDEKACAGHFMVNDCIQRAREKHRPTLDLLRQQEVAQADQRRRAQADERLAALRAKAPTSPSAPRVDKPRSAASDSQEAQARQRMQAASAREHAQAQAQQRQAQALQSAPARERAYQEKLKQAEQHRRDVLQRQEKLAPRAPPLPPAPITRE